jgi:hypothetical protein
VGLVAKRRHAAGCPPELSSSARAPPTGRMRVCDAPPAPREPVFHDEAGGKVSGPRAVGAPERYQWPRWQPGYHVSRRAPARSTPTASWDPPRRPVRLVLGRESGSRRGRGMVFVSRHYELPAHRLPCGSATAGSPIGPAKALVRRRVDRRTPHRRPGVDGHWQARTAGSLTVQVQGPTAGNRRSRPARRVGRRPCYADPLTLVAEPSRITSCMSWPAGPPCPATAGDRCAAPDRGSLRPDALLAAR